MVKIQEVVREAIIYSSYRIDHLQTPPSAAYTSWSILCLDGGYRPTELEKESIENVFVGRRPLRPLATRVRDNQLIQGNTRDGCTSQRSSELHIRSADYTCDETWSSNNGFILTLEEVNSFREVYFDKNKSSYIIQRRAGPDKNNSTPGYCPFLLQLEFIPDSQVIYGSGASGKQCVAGVFMVECEKDTFFSCNIHLTEGTESLTRDSEETAPRGDRFANFDLAPLCTDNCVKMVFYIGQSGSALGVSWMHTFTNGSREQGENWPPLTGRVQSQRKKQRSRHQPRVLSIRRVDM
ncbi:hypothetical protein CBL_10424 [Carabus blaptoides fortunei]